MAKLIMLCYLVISILANLRAFLIKLSTFKIVIYQVLVYDHFNRDFITLTNTTEHLH